MWNALLLCVALFAEPPCAVERAVLTSPDHFYFWPAAIAFDGDTVVTGSPGTGTSSCPEVGSAYIFSRITGSVWGPQSTLAASDGVCCAVFGTSVDVDGDRAIVGALYGSTGDGGVYVFGRTGTTWAEEQILAGSNGQVAGYFGEACAIDGDTIAVGAPNVPFGGASGRVYVFTRSGGTWTEQARIQGGPNDYLGYAVALDGDTIFSGSSVFVRSGTTWSEQATLSLGGTATDLNGDTLVAGSPLDDDVATDAGAVFVAVRQGTVWSQPVKLTAGDAAAGDRFGADVSVFGDLLLVGAPGSDSGAGSAYLFHREGSGWDPIQKIRSSTPTPGHRFSGFVALDGRDMAIGSLPAFDATGFFPGIVHVYEVIDSPTTFCTGKTTSAGCVPFLTSTGMPSVTSSQPFLLRANDVLVGEGGFVLYGSKKSNVNFHGGKLCVKPPFDRLHPVKLAKPGGAGSCGGVLARDFNTRIQQGVDPALTAGATVFAQWYSRDPQDPFGTGDVLTDAVRFQICD